MFVLAVTDGRQTTRERRLPRIEALHLQGYSNVEIAETLDCSERTVARDLKHIQDRRLERFRRKIEAERAHSFALYRKTQSSLWEIVETLMQTDDHKSAIPAIRAIVDSEKAVNGLLDAFAANADSGAASFTDLIAQFTEEELSAATPEQRQNWDAESEAAALRAFGGAPSE